MTIRPDIAEMLRARIPESHIAKQLHVRRKTVADTRKALGLPAPKRGHRPYEATVEDAYRARALPVDDGHLQWTGSFGGDSVPVVNHSSKRVTAYKVAFRLRHGRDPVGAVRPTCGMRGCVSGDHLEDQPMREKNRTAYAAIFGEAS